MDSSGVVKVYDDLFLSDASGARDQQFILLNHVKLVINLTNSFIPNYYQHYGISYINPVNVPTLEEFDKLCDIITAVTDEPNVVLLHGDEALEHPVLLCGIFMMKRFRWSLYKTIEYLQTRVRGLVFQEDAYQIMKKVELQLLNDEVLLSYNWSGKGLSQKELTLRNTYLNSCGKMQAKVDKNMGKKKKSKRVSWNLEGGVKRKVSLRQLNSENSQSSIRNKIILSVRKILTDSNKKSTSSLKPTIPESKYQHCDSLQSLKKHKSSYTLVSLKSIENIRSSSQSHKQSIRLQTEQSAPLEESSQLMPSSSNKKQKMKTEGVQQYRGKAVIDVVLPRKEVTTSCISLVRNLQEKENMIPQKKGGSRKATPSRVAQILARR